MHSRSVVLSVFLSLGCCCAWCPAVRGQQQPVTPNLMPNEAVETNSTAPQRRFADGNQSVAKTPEQIQRWVQDLGASRFSVRERAATELIQSGSLALNELRTALETADDPEVRDRISRLVEQMSDSARQQMIDRFMAGKDVPFEGWPRFREIMGDSVATRELFVDVHDAHPDVLKALDGNATQLAVAMEQVSERIQNQMFVRRLHPTEADTMALMLPMSHKHVRISDSYEITMIGVLDRMAATNIRGDARLEPGFRSLIANWMKRCSLTNRVESLAKAMQWNVDEALPVALSTLNETKDIATLIVAMQTIARFGTKENSVALATILEDNRTTGEAAYGAGQLIQSEVRDNAIATVAILHQIPLADVGFPQASTHPVYGFTITGIGYDAPDAASLRDKNYRRIKKLIDSQRPAGS